MSSKRLRCESRVMFSRCKTKAYIFVHEVELPKRLSIFTNRMVIGLSQCRDSIDELIFRRYVRNVMHFTGSEI
jgi:hypothetical protein